MTSQLHNVVWYIATATALVGVVGVGMGWQQGGVWLVAAGGSILAVLALAAWRIRRADSERLVGGALTILAAALAFLLVVEVSADVLTPRAPSDLRVVALATGAQVLFLAINARSSYASRGTRWVVPLMGHGAVLVGSALMLESGPIEPGAALLAYATGFSSLVLHTFWMRQLIDGVAPKSDTIARWESVLLVALIAGVAGVAAAVFAAPSGEPVFQGPIARPAMIVAGIAAIVALATLAEPPSLPSALDPLTGIHRYRAPTRYDARRPPERATG